MMNENKILSWYQKEIHKDNIELEKSKSDIVNSIKTVDKTHIFKTPEEVKLTLWQRVKKVLMGI
jgi:hypothetical protein